MAGANKDGSPLMPSKPPTVSGHPPQNAVVLQSPELPLASGIRSLPSKSFQLSTFDQGAGQWLSALAACAPGEPFKNICAWPHTTHTPHQLKEILGVGPGMVLFKAPRLRSEGLASLSRAPWLSWPEVWSEDQQPLIRKAESWVPVADQMNLDLPLYRIPGGSSAH